MGKGYDSVFLVTPGHEQRTQLALNGIEAAKKAGVKFLLELSVLTTGTNSIFGKQFSPIENATKNSGLKHAIVRLPLFMDNNYANAESIKMQSTFYDPRDPSKLHTPVAVSDVGKAAADILASPHKHYGKTYKLVSPPFSLNDMATAFSKALGKEIVPTTVSYEAAKDAFMGMGFPECKWMALWSSIITLTRKVRLQMKQMLLISNALLVKKQQPLKRGSRQML